MTTTANHHRHNTTEWQPDTDQHRAERRSLRLSLAAYAVLLAAKLLAYLATDVLAMLAEALHAVSDIFIAGFLLLALHWSWHPPDERHPFGYGRAQAAAGLVAATLFIFVHGAALVRRGHTAAV